MLSVLSEEEQQLSLSSIYFLHSNLKSAVRNSEPGVYKDTRTRVTGYQLY